MKLSTQPLARFLRTIARHPIHFFVITSLLGGLAFIVLVPPFQIPDEFSHFSRAYEVSELKTAQRFHYKAVDFKGSELPASLLKTNKKTRLYRPHGAPDLLVAKKYAWNETSTAAHIPLDKSKVRFYDTGAVPAYFPLLYVPQALAIKLLAVANAPVIAMVYATRLVGLALWILLGALALRILRPGQRLAVAGVLALPMFVAQASASTDPLLNGVTVIYLALIARQLYQKTVLDKRKMTLYAALLFVMVMAKPVYLAFGLLLLILPTVQRGLRGLFVKAACLAVPFVLYGLWVVISRDTGAPVYIDSVAIGHAQPSAQVAYLIPHIFNFVQPFANTFLLGWSDGMYWSLIGNFGKLDTPLPLIFIVLGYIVLFTAIFARVEESKATRAERDFFAWKGLLPITLLTTAAFIGGTYLAMYIYSTPPGQKIVTGVQGRYFLPLLPLLVLFVSKRWLSMRQTAYAFILTIVPVILLVASGLVIFFRFYVSYP